MSHKGHLLSEMTIDQSSRGLQYTWGTRTVRYTSPRQQFTFFYALANDQIETVIPCFLTQGLKQTELRGHSIYKKKSKLIKPNYNLCIVSLYTHTMPCPSPYLDTVWGRAITLRFYTWLGLIIQWLRWWMR